jgi:hypothetical protein
MTNDIVNQAQPQTNNMIVKQKHSVPAKGMPAAEFAKSIVVTFR